MTHFDLDTFWHRCFEFWILSFELSAFSRFWVIKFWVLKFWIFYEKLIQNSIIQNARSAQFLLRQASLRAERKNHNSKKQKSQNLYLPESKPLTKTSAKACTTTDRQLLQTRCIIRNFASWQNKTPHIDNNGETLSFIPLQQHFLPLKRKFSSITALRHKNDGYGLQWRQNTPYGGLI